MRAIEELSRVRRLLPVAKTIYTVAMLENPKSIRDLAMAVNLDRKTTAKHCKELEHLGWLKLISEGDRRRPAAVMPTQVEAMLAAESLKLIDMAPYKGEETTKRFFEWIAAPRVRFLYNCRPDFLTSPETNQPLEYDIFVKAYLWAIEYLGEQHFGLTSLYRDPKELQERQKRDLLKVGLSEKNNVRLSIVTKKDLNLESLLSMVPPDVPRRTFDPKGPFIKMLGEVGKTCATGQHWDRG